MKMSVTRGVVIGSIVGAIFSMLDKKTRDHSIQSIQSLKHDMTDMDRIVGTYQKNAAKVQRVATILADDASFIMEKVEELRQVAPVIASVIRETKDAFYQPKEDKQIQGSTIQYLPKADY